MSIGKTEVVVVCDGPQCESRAYGRTAGAARDSARHPDFGWYVLAGKGGFDFCSGECEQRFIEDVVAETRAREAKK